MMRHCLIEESIFVEAENDEEARMKAIEELYAELKANPDMVILLSKWNKLTEVYDD